jgi:hypothetical protein
VRRFHAVAVALEECTSAWSRISGDMANRLTKLPVITLGADAGIERLEGLVVQIPGLQELIACLSEARLVFLGAVLSDVRDVEDGGLDTVCEVFVKDA